MNKFYRIALLAVALLGVSGLWFTSKAHAQSPYGLQAQIDADTITTDDTVTLTLTLTSPDGRAPKLNLPALDGFNVINTQTASQYSIVNGQTSTSMAYAYELQPTQTGDLVIPALHLNMNGQDLTTEALTVHVTQGNGTPTKKSNLQTNPFGGSAFGSPFGGSAFNSVFGNDPFSDPFFQDAFGRTASLDIQAVTNKQSVYVGEPVEYTVRVAGDGTLLGEPVYEKPQFKGFWAHETDSQRGGSGAEITTLLFPTQAGNLTIDPATIRTDGGFFSEPIEKQTESLAIQVKPLPQGAPAEFNGAVGKFELTATPDKTATRVGEPIVVKYQIRGTGNFDTLPDPKWQNDTNWRAYDAKAKNESSVQFGQLSGIKTFERTLIPTKEGNFTIPAVRYAYFDPSDAQYHTLEAQAIQVNVAPGDPAQTQNVAPATNASAPNNAPVVTNAPALKIAPAQLTSAPKPLSAQPLFWAMFLVPLGLVGIDLAFGLRKRYLDNNAAERRASRAYQSAMKKVRRIKRDDTTNMQIARIVLSYLEDRMNRSLLGVPHSSIAQLLMAHQVSSDAAVQVTELLRNGEVTEFGKLRLVSAQDMVTNATEVLTRVEEEWAE